MGFHRSTLSQGGTAEGPITIQTDNANALLIEQVDGDDVLNVNTSGDGAATFTNHSDGATGMVLNLFQDSASPGADDEVGIINFDGEDSGGAQSTYTSIVGGIDDTTAGAEVGFFDIMLADGTGNGSGLNFSSDGSLVTIAPFDNDDEVVDLQLISGDSGGDVVLTPASSMSVLTGTYSLPTQQVVGAADEAIDVTSFVTVIITDADGTTHTMADGTHTGQLKVIALATDGGGDAVVTPDNLTTGTTLTFADAGDVMQLYWTGTDWFPFTNIGVVVA